MTMTTTLWLFVIGIEAVEIALAASVIVPALKHPAFRRGNVNLWCCLAAFFPFAGSAVYHLFGKEKNSPAVGT